MSEGRNANVQKHADQNPVGVTAADKNAGEQKSGDQKTVSRIADKLDVDDQILEDKNARIKTNASRFDAILDAAELIFADAGFSGASMRAIANRANVAQALIHYHFENKEKLFEAMTARQANAINGARAKLLDYLLTENKPPKLEQVVEALFRPTIETGNKLAKDGGGFSRILVSIANSTDARNQHLATLYYDPIALKFIDAFCLIEPSLKRENAVWAYMFSIGVGMTMMAKTGRSLRLSNGACDDNDIEAMLCEIVVFVCGGIRALVAKRE